MAPGWPSEPGRSGFPWPGSVQLRVSAPSRFDLPGMRRQRHLGGRVGHGGAVVPLVVLMTSSRKAMMGRSAWHGLFVYSSCYHLYSISNPVYPFWSLCQASRADSDVSVANPWPLAAIQSGITPTLCIVGGGFKGVTEHLPGVEPFALTCQPCVPWSSACRRSLACRPPPNPPNPPNRIRDLSR